MVNRVHICFFIIFIAVVTAASGCANGPDHSGEEDKREFEPCGDDCVQPPLKQSELESHLREHQSRILERDEYRNHIPAPITDIIYGPVPKEPTRSGPEIVDENDEPYDGELSWHAIDFEDVVTDGAEHATLRGGDVSGAHCLFAQRPNRYTTLFAVLALHHRDRGDSLYLGGPNHWVTRLDTVPLTDRRGSRIRIIPEQLHCVFRHDQESAGAVIIPYEYTDDPDDKPHYAVYVITTGGEKHATGEFTTVERSAGTRGRQTVQKEVPVMKYPIPNSRFIASHTSLYDAIIAAEENIPAGRFRLRPEFVYPIMPWQSYLDTGEEEFCPVNAHCETPPQYLDKDILPPLTEPAVTDEEEPVADED